MEENHMRTSEITDRSRLIDAAMGRIPCDLTLENIRLVNVLTGEIYPASVDVLDGVVIRTREEGVPAPLPARTTIDGRNRYLIPGFIDAHIHVESTMMIPQQAARLLVPWGTTTICTDPHEIANVMGEAGVQFMLENSRKAALRQYILAPSCVPAVPGLERAGAVFDAAEVSRLLDQPGVVGVAEMMDFMGLVNGSERMSSIAQEGRKRGLLLQGHAPGATGGVLAAYRIGGPVTDHESGTAQEVREKLRAGMHINLRASSIIDNLDELVRGLSGMNSLAQVSICSDDVHAKDVLEHGHINWIVGRLIAGGMAPVTAVSLATIHTAREYGFDDLGAIAPGYQADMQLVSGLDGRQPDAVFIRGRLVAENGIYTAEDAALPCDVSMPNTMNAAGVTCAEDFLLRAPEGRETADVLVLVRQEPGHRRAGQWMTLPVQNGCISLDDHPELQFICVINRYGAGGCAIAVTRDFGLREGAIATTVSHDSHNFTVVYRDAESAYACLQKLSETGGGMCAARGGVCFETLPLPVAGLMSAERAELLAPRIERMEQAMQSLCDKPFSLLNISVYTLPAIPGLVLTDLGLVDSISQTFVEGMR